MELKEKAFSHSIPTNCIYILYSHLLVLTIGDVVLDETILQRGRIEMLDVTTESSILALGSGADGPVCRLADRHNVPNELAQVLLLCQGPHGRDGIM